MFLEITNATRAYDWGSPGAISGLLGSAASGEPEAELWLGDHPGSPASVVGDGLLSDHLAGPLPFLLKVIAAAAPLSLQVHPDLRVARKGFAREEAAGIDRDAPRRTYRDPYAKPELLYALETPFRALAGARPAAEVRAVLAPLAHHPEVASLRDRLRSDSDVRDAIGWLLRTDPAVPRLVATIVENRSELETSTSELVGRLAERYPGDPAIVAALFLVAVELSAGDVIYLPAGTPHAYLEGLGIELMGSSDNVIRAGLTSKFVDVDELLRVTDFTPGRARHLAGEPLAPGVERFAPEGSGIALTVARPEAELPVELDLARPTIVLCTLGEAQTPTGRVLRRGEAWFVRDEPSTTFRGEATLFVATGERD